MKVRVYREATCPGEGFLVRWRRQTVRGKDRNVLTFEFKSIDEILENDKLYMAVDESNEFSVCYVRWLGPGYYGFWSRCIGEGKAELWVRMAGDRRENLLEALESARDMGLTSVRWANTPEEAAWPYLITEELKP